MTRALKIIAAVSLAAAGVFTAVALAHTGTSEVTCAGVKFAYYNFEGNPHRVLETVTEGAAVLYTGPFVFQGPSAAHTVLLSLSGDRVVRATASWTDDGGGSYDSGPVHLLCQTATVTTTVPVTTTVTTPGATTTVTVTTPGPAVTTPGTAVAIPASTVTVERATAGKTVTFTTPGKTVTVKAKPKVRTVVKTRTVKVVVVKTRWRTRTVTVHVPAKKQPPRFLGGLWDGPH